MQEPYERSFPFTAIDRVYIDHRRYSMFATRIAVCACLRCVVGGSAPPPACQSLRLVGPHERADQAAAGGFEAAVGGEIPLGGVAATVAATARFAAACA